MIIIFINYFDKNIYLGTILFGGRLRTNLNINFQQYGDPNYFVYSNFNDFGIGLVTCFHLMMVNNWLYTVDVICRVMGSFSYRFFFISFYLFAVVGGVNLIIAFIIDMFVNQMNAFNQEEKKKLDEIKINNPMNYSVKEIKSKMERSSKIFDQKKSFRTPLLKEI